MKNLIAILFFVPLFAQAQTTHTVAPKETLYSLGRQYNIHPKELAAYNNISVETGLTIGQVIKIPAKATIPPLKSATPSSLKTGTAEKKTGTIAETGSAPLYHKVQKKETLFHISKLYNITVDDIKKWNHLSSDGVSEGTNLVIGYQKGKKEEPVAAVAVKEERLAKPVAVEPQKEIPAKEESIAAAQKNAAVTEQPKTIPVKTAEPDKEGANKVTGKNANGGFFKTLYNEQAAKKPVVEETGTAAIFKSTSGWEDGKYYCLHNTAPAGSIVKITNKTTQKSVYAKVLDVIPDLKQNAGIMIRLSNAAADELGAGESNFESVINY